MKKKHPAARSDEWTSRYPQPYLTRLRTLCLRELANGWSTVTLLVALQVGATESDYMIPEVVSWLQVFCLREIHSHLERGETVCDLWFQIYNLCTRAMETGKATREAEAAA